MRIVAQARSPKAILEQEILYEQAEIFYFHLHKPINTLYQC